MVLEIAAPRPTELLVELGAGTGQIGQHLIESVRYLGIDRSRRMLELFRGRLATGHIVDVRLSHMDADLSWPVSDRSVAVVFASRAAHLLAAEHLAAELRRVCQPGSYFLVGRVIRDPHGLKSRLRRQRRLLLRRHGLAPQDARATERVLEPLLASGATRVEARVATSWIAAASIREILAGWDVVGAMGGQQLDAATRACVLAELEQWAAREVGDPCTVATWEERYVLEGVRMAGRRPTCGVV